MTDVLIEGNLFSNNGDGDVVCAGMAESSIISNVMYGHGTAVHLFPWRDVPGPSQVLIAHNTVHTVGTGPSVWLEDLVGPIYLRNNLILHSATTAPAPALYFPSAADVTGVNSDYNVIGAVKLNTSILSFAQWRAMTAGDGHSVDGSSLDVASGVGATRGTTSWRLSFDGAVDGGDWRFVLAGAGHARLRGAMEGARGTECITWGLHLPSLRGGG